jgi:hypothetical protein
MLRPLSVKKMNSHAQADRAEPGTQRKCHSEVRYTWFYNGDVDKHQPTLTYFAQ